MADLENRAQFDEKERSSNKCCHLNELQTRCVKASKNHGKYPKTDKLVAEWTSWPPGSGSRKAGWVCSESVSSMRMFDCGTGCTILNVVKSELYT